MTQNQIKYQELEEARYHNRVMEQETKRSNQANERIKDESNAINQMHYMYSDAETARANQAREMENSQHNRTTEAIQWFTANSEARLRNSQMALNTSQIAVNEADIYKKQWEAEKAHAEKMLTDAKIITEQDYQQPYIESSRKKLESDIELNAAKTKTEKWNAMDRLTSAGLKMMDMEWYGTKQRNSVLQWAGNMATNLVGSFLNSYSSINSAGVRLQGDLIKGGYYSPSYSYNIE